MYINSRGQFFPCSFTEGEKGWEKSINVLGGEEFWMHPRTVDWREKLLKTTDDCDCKFKDGCRSCPVFDITGCKERL